MNIEIVKELVGKNVMVDLEEKSINGNIIEYNIEGIKLETDFGVIEIKYKKIKDINRFYKIAELNVFVCKNEVLGCKGMRLLSTKEDITWKCKYSEKYNCPIKKICNFNELPLNIKVSFLDGLHTDIPVIEEKK